MRIISQNRKIDLPYEDTVIHTEYFKLEPRVVVAIFKGEKYTLGTYSTEEKAIKAMEMLRKAYVGMPIIMQNVDISEDVSMEFERLKKYGIMVQTKNQPSKVDFINNAVFQFPQDDEIEV